MSETNSVLPDPDASPTGLSPASMGSLPGVDRFAHFVVNRLEDGELDRLGVGAMGVTYRAIDTQLERLVALKTIHPQWVDDPDVRTRFAREAKAAARIQHPHIASVLFQGEEASVCFYVMELVAGESLHHYVRRVGPLSPVHALRMVHQIALALVAAAREGVIHRDLKPANVMLTSYHDGTEPHLKVIDFGLAKLAAEVSATVTSGGFLGTPEFASPEQCEEKPLDARSDIYSLGGVLWFLLTASSPFSGSLIAVIRAQISTQPAWDKLPGAPGALLTLLGRLLAKNRDFRPATPLEAAQEIEHAIQVLSQDRKNFFPLGTAHEGADVSAGSLPSVSSAASAAATGRESASRGSSIRWIIPALISSLCFAGGIYKWRISRAHPVAIQNASEARASATVPPDAEAAAPRAESAQPSLPSPPNPAETPAPAKPIVSVPATPAPQTVAADKAKTPSPASASSPVSADENAPAFTNSLGMRFVHPQGYDILASVWITRVRDFEAYASKSSMLTSIAMDARERSWRNPGFAQTRDDPVVYVSPPDAVAFCQWLTDKEHRSGILPAYEFYRLPNRIEWDELRTGHLVPKPIPIPVPPPMPMPMPFPFPIPGQPPGSPPGFGGGFGHPGTPAPSLQSPAEAQYQAATAQASAEGPTPFYWGTFDWPPPQKFANYGAGAYSSGKTPPTAGDGFAYTSPVGSFSANVLGLYDMTGNAAQICVDGPPLATVYIRQGGSWASTTPTELRMRQVTPVRGAQRDSTTSFRCVIARY